jgi:rubrerythrin
MNPFDFSIEMEKDAEELYRDLASREKIEGVSKVLNMLADDEVRHRENIERLKNRMPIQPDEGVEGKIKTVFDDLRQNLDQSQISEDTVDEYRRALDIEQKGIDFYKQQFEEQESDEAKRLFKAIMQQEEYHYRVVDHLLEMVQKPQWWVEDAEFTPKGTTYY